MYRRFVVALLFVGLTACAVEPVATPKVDVSDVVDVGAVTAVDGVTSSGQPNESALDVFSDSGYAAVIDLRGPDENRGFDEASAVETRSMNYVSLPILGQGAINYDNAARLDALIDSFDGPVLVHCGSGNRAGALLALRASIDGASDEEALDVGKARGLTRLEEVVKQRLAEK